MIRKETAHQLFTRLGNQKFGNYGLAVFAEHPVTTGHLVEVCSEESVGHSVFLYHVMTRHLVQKRDLTGGVSGNGHIVFLSTRYTINAVQLKIMLQSRIAALGATNVSDCTRKCLEMVHVLFCDSSAELLLTLTLLTTFLNQQPSTNLVVIDDIGAYYWSDRYSSNSSKMYPDEVARPLSSSLANLFANHGLAIVVGKSTLLTSKSGDLIEYMPSYWQKMVTHRVVLINSGCKVTGQEIGQKVFFMNLKLKYPSSSLATETESTSEKPSLDLPSPESVHVLFKCCDVVCRNSKPFFLLQFPTGLLNIRDH